MYRDYQNYWGKSQPFSIPLHPHRFMPKWTQSKGKLKLMKKDFWDIFKHNCFFLCRCPTSQTLCEIWSTSELPRCRYKIKIVPTCVNNKCSYRSATIFALHKPRSRPKQNLVPCTSCETIFYQHVYKRLNDLQLSWLPISSDKQVLTGQKVQSKQSYCLIFTIFLVNLSTVLYVN